MAASSHEKRLVLVFTLFFFSTLLIIIIPIIGLSFQCAQGRSGLLYTLGFRQTEMYLGTGGITLEEEHNAQVKIGTTVLPPWMEVGSRTFYISPEKRHTGRIDGGLGIVREQSGGKVYDIGIFS